METREPSLTLAERLGNRSEYLADIFEFAASPQQLRELVELYLCTGCQECVNNCNFDAMTMVSVPGDLSHYTGKSDILT